MGKLFGTDGIRGVVNAGLDAALAYQVGAAMFSNQYGLLGVTKQAREILSIWNKEREFFTP